jgi:hypothetical protein
MLNYLSQAGVPRVDVQDAGEIAKHVRGTGLFTLRKTLYEACSTVGADCTEFVEWSRCIEERLRDPEFLVENSVNGIPTVMRGDLFDAHVWCERQRPPDTPVADPTDPNPIITLPTLPFPRPSPYLIGAAVAAVGVAAWAIHSSR